MDEKTRSALEESIVKWQCIVAREKLDHGWTDCALCSLFFENDCAGCPVMLKTGKDSCLGTPYEVWCGYDCRRVDDPKRYSDTQIEIAKKEVLFLEGLRDE